jgi:SAM-dependent methyltransferase
LTLPTREFHSAANLLREQTRNFVEPRENEERGELSFEFADPDGHRIEVVADADSQERESWLWTGIAGTWTRGPREGSFRDGLFAEQGNRYERNARRYPWYREALDPLLADAMYEWCPVPGRLVEFGCGYGLIASRLAAVGYEVVALDASENVVQANVRSFGDVESRLTFRAADVTKPIPDLGEFDYVLDQGCFHEFGWDLTHRRGYLTNLNKVLRKGGIYIITTRSALETTSGFSHTKWLGRELEETFERSFVLRYQTIYSQFGTAATYNKEKRLFCVFEKVR